MGLINSLIEAIPLFYLLVLCILDIRSNFHLRIFFCSIVQEIHKNRDSIRRDVCQAYDTDPDNCPVFSIISRNEQSFPEDCPKIFLENIEERAQSQAFWKIIINGINMFHQATFLEIIAIQFVILAAVTESKVIMVFGLVFGVALLFVGIGIYTYSTNVRTPIFPNAWIRLAIVFGVLIMFIALTSMENIKIIDTYIVDFLSSHGFKL